MRINYVTVANDKLASFRYHIKTPAIELHKLGHKVFISSKPVVDCDAYIFHKHLRSEDPYILKEIKNRYPNSKTIFICCDYHLDGKFADHYHKMIAWCDQLVVCTAEMSRILLEECKKESTIIEDPWEIKFNEKITKFKKKNIYNLLWFGSRTNINSLFEIIPDLKDHNLTVVTEHDPGVFEVKGKNINFINHSQSRVGVELDLCDIVIIPQSLDSKSKLVKTHNRLVDAIRSGRFTIASPIPAYLELKDFAFIGDIGRGIDWIESQSESNIVNMIDNGKEYINTRFSPAIIGKKWEEFLSSPSSDYQIR